jgi:HK97 family phage major capsid protein
VKRRQIDPEKAEALRLAIECKEISRRWKRRTMPDFVGEDWAAKVERAAELMGTKLPEGERMSTKAEKKERDPYWDAVPPGATPIPLGPEERKRRGLTTAGEYGGLTPGEAFVTSEVFRAYEAAGYPVGMMTGKAAVPDFQVKALPTLGSSPAVIQPQRMAEFVRTNEFDRLRLRDIVGPGSTSSNMVEFYRITSGQSETATTVADTLTGENTKPESTMALEVATAPVRTLAVWMPVTEAMLEDVTQLRSLIDTELRFDVARLEEYQMVWGDGTGTDLLGIMETPGVTEFTRDLTGQIGAGSTVTVLDKIRGAITDVRVSNHEPSAVVIHPEDFEALALQKGSDDHYLIQVFPQADGSLRAWSLTVVEAQAASAYRSGLQTPQRVIIVGDFRRGAQLWDRHQASVEVGYINNQFIQNQRTIRAEERVAFASKRPSAFKYIETVAASAS